MHVRGFFLLLILLALAALGLAGHRALAEGNTGGITVVKHVLDAAGRPQQSADVSGYTFTIAGDGVTLSHMTSASGAITVLGLAPGVYTVTEASDARSTFARIAALDQSALQNGGAVTVEAGVAVIVDVYNIAVASLVSPAGAIATESATPSLSTSPAVAATPSPEAPDPRLSPTPSVPSLLASTPAATLSTSPSGAGAPVLELLPGQNHVAYFGPTLPVADALRSIDGRYTQVSSWDRAFQRWISYYPGNPAASGFQMLSSGSAYLVTARERCSLRQDGADMTFVATPLDLQPGFNDVAYRGPTGPIADVLGPLLAKVVSIEAYDAASQTWQVYSPAAPGRRDFADLTHGEAYFINLAGP